MFWGKKRVVFIVFLEQLRNGRGGEGCCGIINLATGRLGHFCSAFVRARDARRHRTRAGSRADGNSDATSDMLHDRGWQLTQLTRPFRSSLAFLPRDDICAVRIYRQQGGEDGEEAGRRVKHAAVCTIFLRHRFKGYDRWSS